MIPASFQILYFICWRLAERVVPQAAVMESEPPGSFFFSSSSST